MEFSDTTVFRKTEAGKDEMATRGQALHQRYRRALILVDGKKDLAEMSVLLRAGEIEIVFPHLFERELIEIVSDEELAADSSRMPMVPAARDPAVFAEIRDRAIARIESMLGEGADMVVGEIESSQTADELRVKLRDLEDIFVGVLGENEGVQLARQIGGELLVLVPRQPNS
jgi:hypothetical protein